MPAINARTFLTQYASLFDAAEVAGWHWEDEDDEFGKRTSWPVGAEPTLQTTAAVDLMLNQLQLHVSERDLDTDEQQTQTVFEALISFDDRTITINGEALPFDDTSITTVIARFNEVA